MSASGSEPGPEQHHAAASARFREEPGLLERVLRETAMESLSADPSPVQLGVLKEVARKHRGAEGDDESVATDLVKAVLQAQLANQFIAQHIARAILDDDVSRDRLKALWSRLMNEL